VAQDADANDTPPFWKLPDHLRALVENIGFIPLQPEDEDEARIYTLMRAGKCMTCRGDLEERSNFIIDRHGIIGAYCSGQCHADMAVLGFLGEQHDDIITSVKFRGDFPADEASEAPD